MDASKIISPDFSSLLQKWPSSFVARCEVARFTGGIVNPRTLANLDSLGKGPPGRVRIGRKIAYNTKLFTEWLTKRAEVV